MIDLVKAGDAAKLQSCMLSGISLNPCNSFGESLLHMVCRRGDAKLLEVMLNAGTSLEVADDYGRCVLHDACWAAEPAFDVVRLILNSKNEADSNNLSMFMMQDARGALPLTYVHRDQWADWIQFLDRDKDIYWPLVQDPSALTSPLVYQAPNTRPVQDPHNALGCMAIP